MEPKDSSRYTSKTTTGSYRTPDKLSSHHHILPTKMHFNIIFLTATTFSKWSLPFSLNLIHISHLSSTSYMPCPSHSPSLHYHNNVWQRVQVINIFIMQFSWVMSYLLHWVQRISSPPSRTLSICVLNLQLQTTLNRKAYSSIHFKQKKILNWR